MYKASELSGSFIAAVLIFLDRCCIKGYKYKDYYIYGNVNDS